MLEEGVKYTNDNIAVRLDKISFPAGKLILNNW